MRNSPEFSPKTRKVIQQAMERAQQEIDLTRESPVPKQNGIEEVSDGRSATALNTLIILARGS